MCILEPEPLENTVPQILWYLHIADDSFTVNSKAEPVTCYCGTHTGM